MEQEVGLPEKKQAMKELWKESWRSKVEGWRDTVAAEGLLRRQQLGLKAPIHRKDTEEAEIPWQGAATEKESSGT